MKNENYYILENIVISNIINPDWQSYINPLDSNWVFPYPTYILFKIFDARFIANLFKWYKPTSLLVFNRVPSGNGPPIHIDYRYTYALNLVVGQGSMFWFGPGEEKISYTSNNIPTITIEYPNPPKIIEQCDDFKCATFVRTDVPHTIQAINSTRTCFSIRNSKKSTYDDELGNILNLNDQMSLQ